MDFVVEFRGDKIVFVVKSASAGKHYTFQAGSKSGVIDLGNQWQAQLAPTLASIAIPREDYPQYPFLRA